LEKPGKIFIIPVKLEECEIPKRLTRYQWVDLYRTDGRKRLLMGLNMRIRELGDEVFPLIEETRPRVPKPAKLEKQEELNDLILPEEIAKEEPGTEVPELPLVQKDEIEKETFTLELKKEIEREKTTVPEDKTEDFSKLKPIVEKKPYTRILNPASLEKSQPKEIKLTTKKPIKNNNLRWLSIGGLILFALVFGGFVLNYLIQNKPVNSTPEITSTPTFTPQPNKTPDPNLGIGSTMISEKDGMTLLYVPEGEFTMGSNDFPDEQPIHQVNLDAYWIDQTEVTNAMYTKCVEANQCDLPSNANNYNNGDYADHPVTDVSWNDANVYCIWAGRRLPTEAEWEKAARGTNGNTFPWGNELPNANLLHYNDEVDDTAKVGNFPNGASVYGVYDMAGNVSEWVSSLYQPYPYDATDGREDLNSSNLSDLRVLRGGSWWYYDNLNIRSADRGGNYQTIASNSLGFRCALSGE